MKLNIDTNLLTDSQKVKLFDALLIGKSVLFSGCCGDMAKEEVTKVEKLENGKYTLLVNDNFYKSCIFNEKDLEGLTETYYK